MFAFRSFLKFHLNIPNEFTQNMPSNNLMIMKLGCYKGKQQCDEIVQNYVLGICKDLHVPLFDVFFESILAPF